MTGQRILFLDIDGVLVPGRTLVLPANLASVRDEKGARRKPRELGPMLTFDASAVALLNRLCEKTGARIVVHSNWRINVGLDETRAKLIEQGVEERRFHEKWACPARMRSDKAADICSWIRENRPTPAPSDEGVEFGPETSLTRAQKKRLRAYRTALANTGIDAIVVDDEDVRLVSFDVPQMKTDFDEGLTLAAYRALCGAWRTADPMLGVRAVADADWDMAVKAFAGDRLAASAWLHDRAEFSRAWRLDAEAVRRDALRMQLFGFGSDPERDVREFREKTLAQIAEVAAERARQRRRSARDLAKSRRRLSADF